MKIAEKLREISDIESTSRHIQEHIKKEPYATPIEIATVLKINKSTIYRYFKKHCLPVSKKISIPERITKLEEKAKRIASGTNMTAFVNDGHVYIFKPIKLLNNQPGYTVNKGELWACEAIEIK